jgi:hypothetical protein
MCASFEFNAITNKNNKKMRAVLDEQSSFSKMIFYPKNYNYPDK